MSSWVVLGGTGMLGQDVVRQAWAAGHDVLAAGSRDVDITDLDAVRSYVSAQRPDIVVNCAAHTAVDAAESQEDAAFALNAVGARNVARVVHDLGARLVHVSTDYVFDGSSSEPYGVDEPQNPRSAYGRTKAAGEWAVRAEHPDAAVVRTAWLYGAGGRNFVQTMLELSRSKDTLDVVADQIGQPTWTQDVADLVVGLVDGSAAGGYYHATSAGRASWCDFAREVYRSAGLEPQRIRPTTSKALPRPAPRPAFSVLAPSPGTPGIGTWQERLAASGLASLGAWT